MAGLLARQIALPGSCMIATLVRQQVSERPETFGQPGRLVTRDTPTGRRACLPLALASERHPTQGELEGETVLELPGVSADAA